MEVIRSVTAEELGAKAAAYTAKLINACIARKGECRICLSTGASQFTTLSALVREDIDWSKVTCFHLDEYVGLDESHPASFVRYLKERFVAKLPKPPAAFYFVEPWKFASVDACIENLTALIREKPIDVGLIGIGENTHIAFNDPPADFEDKGAYKVVELDERCRRQQLGEGWFAALDDVPRQAISMTVWQIRQCEKIVSAVPYAVKAEAIYKVLNHDVRSTVPATALRYHRDWKLFIDADSGALVENIFKI